MDIGGNNTNISVVHESWNCYQEETTITVTRLGYNAVQVVPINIRNISQLRVNLAGSGAVTFISFCFTLDGSNKPPVLTPMPSQVPQKTLAPSPLPRVSLAPSHLPLDSLSSLPSASPSSPSSHLRGYAIVIIAFSLLPDGVTVVKSRLYASTEWLDLGLTISASGGHSSLPCVLNTSDVSGNASLGSPNSKCSPPGPGIGEGGEPVMLGENCNLIGNVLIVQKEDTEQPEASPNGGVITYDFLSKVLLVYSVCFMGIEGNSTTIAIAHDDGARSTTIAIIRLGRNSIQTVFIRMECMTRLDMNFLGPGAVVSVSVSINQNGGIPSPVMPSMPSPSPSPFDSTLAQDNLIVVKIDFNGLPDGLPMESGSTVSDQWLDEVGFRISATGGCPCLLNTSDVGIDTNLGSPNKKCASPGTGSGAGGEPNMPGANCISLGKVLIVTQSNESEAPRANGDEGAITFDFSPIAPLIHSISLMGTTENHTTITVVYEDGERTTDITVKALGSNSMQSVSIELERVSQLIIRLLGTAAVTDISIGKDPFEVVCQPVSTPQPRSLPRTFPPTTAGPIESARPSFSSQFPSEFPVQDSSFTPHTYNDENVIIDFDTFLMALHFQAAGGVIPSG